MKLRRKERRELRRLYEKGSTPLRSREVTETMRNLSAMDMVEISLETRKEEEDIDNAKVHVWVTDSGADYLLRSAIAGSTRRWNTFWTIASLLIAAASLIVSIVKN